MLRRRMGDARFLAMLAAILQRYDRADITTEEFRLLAAGFMPKTDDPRLEAFFDQWVYGTGIPSLKLAYRIRGAARRCAWREPSRRATPAKTSAYRRRWRSRSRAATR